jgi:hypothetical protein
VEITTVMRVSRPPSPLQMMVDEGRRHMQLLDDLNERRGYWKLEALKCTVWRTRFGRGYKPVIRHITE